MEERQRGGKPRHPAVVAADVQPSAAAAPGEEAADHHRVMPLGRAEQRDRAGVLGKRAGELSE